MRPVVSYDDITLPYELSSAAVQEASKVTSSTKSDTNNHTNKSKKRKRKSRNSAGNLKSSDSQPDAYEGQEGSEYWEVEESRELTHEEVWDDSALIEAWNAATEEYKAYNGPDKGWKHEPVHKSPLWYNVPPPPSKKQKISQTFPPTVLAGLGSSAEQNGIGGADMTMDFQESDSKPIDFDTFVPGHDAGLSTSAPAAPKTGASGRDFSSSYAAFSPVSQDEAFQRALEATYWSGYWTAVYHMKGETSKPVEEKEKGDAQEGNHQVAEFNNEVEGEGETTVDDARAVLDIGDGNDDESEGENDEDIGLEENVEEGDAADSAVESGADFVSTQR